MSNVVFVSVAQSFERGMTTDQLMKVAQTAWAISEMTHLVTVFEGRPIMAWQILDAYKTDETYKTPGRSVHGSGSLSARRFQSNRRGTSLARSSGRSSDAV